MIFCLNNFPQNLTGRRRRASGDNTSSVFIKQAKNHYKVIDIYFLQQRTVFVGSLQT